MSAKLTITRTSPKNDQFVELVRLLDAELAIRDGDEHEFYDQFNKIDWLQHCIVCHSEGKPIACGAIKAMSGNSMEVKRMYTLPEFRGAGIATYVLLELEKWARELGAEKCMLETGKKQPEAISLYKKNGYRQIPNYGQYKGIENSLCFEKRLMDQATD